MINKILDVAFNDYSKVKEEVLNNCSLTCRCKNPGLELKCMDCPEYLNIVDIIQHQLYENPKGECFNPNNPLLEKDIRLTKRYSKEDRNKAITLYKESGDIKKVSNTLGIPYPTIYGWVKYNKAA